MKTIRQTVTLGLIALGALGLIGCRRPAPEVARRLPEEEQYELGQRLAQKGEEEQALQAFATAARINPGYAPAVLTLAEYEQRNGALMQAANRLEALQRAAPKTPDLSCRLAEIYLQSGRFVKGAKLAQAELQQNPNCPLAQAQLGLAYLMSGESGQGAEAMAKAHREAPQAELFTLALAQMLALSGKSERSWSLLEELPARLRYPAKTEYLRGWLLAEYGKAGKKDPAQALTHLEAALRATPDYPPALQEKGRILLRQGKAKEAQASLDRARQSGAFDAEAMQLYADVTAKMGGKEAAGLQQQAKRARQFEAELHAARKRFLAVPNDAANILPLAKAEAQNGNSQDARDLIVELLKKDPKNAQALELLQSGVGAPAPGR